MSSEQGPIIRALAAADAEAYRAIRLEALRQAPDAFASSYEEESARPIETFGERLAGKFGGITFGAIVDREIAGTAGGVREDRLKTNHKLLLVGVYVRAAHRGRGLGERLVARVLQHARELGDVRVVQLKVACDNRAACALYDRMGLTVYGIERKAIKLGERFIDEELRAIEL
ncbi:MAG TPA: GNAT family N-acetyltransferase [Dongiaceae bacterium]